MKTLNTIKFLTAGLAVLLLGACNDQLDLPSDGRIPRDQIFANRDNARGYLAGTYGKAVGFNVIESNFTDECEEASHSEGIDRYVRWYGGNVSARDFGGYSKDGDPWGSLYQGIRRCNVFLEGMKNYDGLAFGENRNEVNAWLAQAYTLRAFYYLQLIKRYGSVPYFTDELNPDRDASGDVRMSFSKVARRIIDDCRAALDTPDYGDQFSFGWIIYQNQNGIMHRGVAYAVMAEAALFAASPLHAEDGGITWQEAMEICGEALHQCLENGYELFTVAPDPADAQNAYAYYFLYNPFDQRMVDKETIYVNAGAISMWRSAGLPGTNGQESAGPCPVQELVDCYEMKATGRIPITGYEDGDHKVPIVDLTSGYDPADPYVGRDPRFYASIYFNGAERELGKTNPQLVETYVGGKHMLWPGNRRYTQTGYYIRKYSDWRGDVNNKGGDGSPRMYRLGWLYLNFAEAAYQATGDPYRQIEIGEGRTMSAVDAVNAIRRRADMPDLPAGLSKDEFEKRYRNERRVELAFEGHRYFDVRRWKILDRTEPVVTGMDITRSNGNLTYTRIVVGKRQTADDKYLLYPISEVEMRKVMVNSGVSWGDWQNSGW